MTPPSLLLITLAEILIGLEVIPDKRVSYYFDDVKTLTYMYHPWSYQISQ